MWRIGELDLPFPPSAVGSPDEDKTFHGRFCFLFQEEIEPALSLLLSIQDILSRSKELARWIPSCTQTRACVSALPFVPPGGLENSSRELLSPLHVWLD